MKQIYIHGSYPGGNGRLTQVLMILGFDRVVSKNDCKNSKEVTLEITKSQAFYTNRIVEDEFEYQLADRLDLDIISGKKLESMCITKIIELTEERHKDKLGG